MKRLLGFVAGALASLAMLPAAAYAAPVQSTDTEGPGLHTCISASGAACLGGGPFEGSATLWLDVTADDFVADSLITEATLALSFSDDGGPGDGSEKLDLKLDNATVQSNANVNHDLVITFSDFTALADGTLKVEIIGRSGDFFLEGATLRVVGEPPTTGQQEGTTGSEQGPIGATAVPAPAAGVLLAMGLLGLHWRRRAAR